VIAGNLVGQIPDASNRSAFGRNFGRGSECDRPDIVTLDDLVHKADLEGCVGRKVAAAGNHVERRFDADQTRRALGAAGSRNDPERDFRQAAAPAWNHGPVVTSQRHFQAAAKRGSMQHGQDRFFNCVELIDDIGQGGRLGRLSKLANIGSGDKRSPGADQRYHLHIVVGAGLLHEVGQAGPNRLTKGIDRWVVDRDQTDAIHDFQANRIF